MLPILILQKQCFISWDQADSQHDDKRKQFWEIRTLEYHSLVTQHKYLKPSIRINGRLKFFVYSQNRCALFGEYRYAVLACKFWCMLLPNLQGPATMPHDSRENNTRWRLLWDCCTNLRWTIKYNMDHGTRGRINIDLQNILLTRN